MDRYAYYEYLKGLAHETRERYGLTSRTISLSTLRGVYRQERIQIDYWKHKLRKVRGAYFLVDDEPHVLVNGAIKPNEPRIFILAHELKHHLTDQDVASQSTIGCQEISWSDGSPIEIGAEVFAAELIYPESEFLTLADEMGLMTNGCGPQDVVRLKRQCPAPISYAFLIKRLEWFRIAERGAFRGVRFQNLEESMFGKPFYRR